MSPMKKIYIIQLITIAVLSSCIPNRTIVEKNKSQQILGTLNTQSTSNFISPTLNLNKTETPTIEFTILRDSQTPITIASTETIVPIKTSTEVPGVILTDSEQNCQKVPPPEITKEDESGILYSGKFYLCEYWPIGENLPNDQALWGFDFDSAQVSGIYNTNIDIYYYILWNKVDNNSENMIMSTNNSKLFITHKMIPNYENCKNEIKNNNRAENIMLNVDSSEACIITNGDRLAFMKVDEVNPYGNGSLSVFFITWDELLIP
jgi:hypothetical protein